MSIMHVYGYLVFGYFVMDIFVIGLLHELPVHPRSVRFIAAWANLGTVLPIIGRAVGWW